MNMASWYDSITNLFNSLINRRRGGAGDTMTADFVPPETLRQIYRTGIGSKIIRLKAGYALDDTLQFESEKDRDFYNARLAKDVKRAAKFMLGFGRAIIVLYEQGEELSTPRRQPYNPDTVKIKVFSGDMVTGISPSLDLMNDRYYKPTWYSVRGHQFHHTRVIDFTYVEPPEFDSPQYQYGGISEFELIYTQLINDGIVERAVPTILEKNSTIFYKVKGFKEAMQDGRDKDMIRYFGRLEDGRNIYGAGLLDAEDEAMALNQTLTNLSESDMVTLRRLAMVTGIPLSLLVGENVKGLNSSGDNEMTAFQQMEETLQSDYLLEPISELFRRLDLGNVSFRDNQGQTAGQRVDYERKAVDTALILWQMGEDYNKYLEEKGVMVADNWDKVFPKEAESPPPDPPEQIDLQSLLGGSDGQA